MAREKPVTRPAEIIKQLPGNCTKSSFFSCILLYDSVVNNQLAMESPYKHMVTGQLSTIIPFFILSSLTQTTL